jgi:hypothetical protein
MRLNRNAEADRSPILHTPKRSQLQKWAIAIAAGAFVADGNQSMV